MPHKLGMLYRSIEQQDVGAVVCEADMSCARAMAEEWLAQVRGSGGCWQDGGEQ